LHQRNVEQEERHQASSQVSSYLQPALAVLLDPGVRDDIQCFPLAVADGLATFVYELVPGFQVDSLFVEIVAFGKMVTVNNVAREAF